MYWPLGTPRVYIVPQRPKSHSDDDEEEGESSQEPSSTTITGLQTSRNGAIFATITATTLSIWQVSVRAVVSYSSSSD